MKKFSQKSIVSFLIIFLLFGATFALAASGPYPGLQVAAGDTGLNKSLPKFVGLAVQGILATLGLVLVLVLIYAGVMWGFFSAGDSKKVQTAKDMIKNAVIGLILVLASYAIAVFITDNLTSSGQELKYAPTYDPSAPGSDPFSL